MTTPTPTDPISTTLNQREVTYGDFADVAYTAQSLLEAMKNVSRQGSVLASWPALMPYQREALQLIATKISRILNGDPNHIDSWHDIAGYATLVEVELRKGRASNPTDRLYECPPNANMPISRDFPK